MPQGILLDGSRELEMIRQENPLLGRLAERIIEGVNSLAKRWGGAPLGELPAPSPVDSTSVKGTYNAGTNTLTAPGEILHWVHTHNVPLQRGIQYVTEISDNPSFTNAHPVDTGSSRSGLVSLPTLNDLGSAVGYYLRVTAQLPGSVPSEPTVFGGLQSPTKIVFSGSTQMTLLTSQNGGTALPGQSGQGLGTNLFRPSVSNTKRSF